MAAVIEIGKIGRQVDSRGIAKSFTPEFFQEVIESYNPSNFKAPAIISHDTQGVLDKELHKNGELSYGVAQKLTQVGDRLKVVFNKLSPKIKKHFDDGELLSVSPSFYPPNHHANPTPGKWSLRHVAFLGKTPPAIKGLASPEFAEIGFNPTENTLDFSFPVTMQETDDTLEFSIFSRAAKTLLSNLRDWLIERHGKEETEKILPAMTIEEMEMGDRYLNDEISDLRREIMKLKYPPQSKEPEVAIATHYEEYDFKEMNIGKKLEKLAKEKDVDLATLAKAAGITEGTVSQIINGDIEKPPKKRLEGFAKALGVSLDMLMPKDYQEDDLDDEDDLDEEDDLDDDDDKPTKTKQKQKTMELNEETPINYAEELAEERRQRKLLEAQFQNEQRKAEVERQKRKHESITNFCENLVKDGYLAASQQGDRIISFGEGEEESLDLPEFMMSLDDKQLSFMKDYLQSQPKVIDYGEFAPDNQTPNGTRDVMDFGVVPGATVSQESVDEYQEILHYCETHSLNPDNDDDFNKAAKAVLS